MASWTNPLDYSIGQATCVQRFDEQILDNLTFTGCHAHSGSAGDGFAISGSLMRGTCGIQSVYQYVTLTPFLIASGGIGLISVDGNAINGGYCYITNTLGGSAKYLVDCGAGTWAISFYYRTQTNGGIISACFNGASIGQVNMYAGTAANNNLSSTSSFSIAASGQYVLKFEAVDKDVSSTDHVGALHHIELRRLSA